MHFLFATSIVPDGRLGSGYEIANEAIIGALRRLGVRVTVLGFTWPGREASIPDETIVLGATDVRTDEATAIQKVRWLAMALRNELTFASAKLRIVDEQTVRAAIQEAGPIDGYILNSVQFAGAFESCFRDKPYAFVAHNVEAQSARENAATARGVIQRLLFVREARLLRSLEARLCNNARFVFTLAEEDRESLGVASSERSATLPLVTRPQAPALLDANRKPEYDAALIGTWTWEPNRVGLEWFLDRVTPHLPADFSTMIAGNVPAGITSTHPGVKFVGRVRDAHDFVTRAAVIPLVSRGGTGVQLKTIETFELGLPSVATSSALRGIINIAANCVVEDDPKAFAAALCTAVSTRPNDIDGRVFYQTQRSELDRQIGKGLARFGMVEAEAFA